MGILSLQKWSKFPVLRESLKRASSLMWVKMLRRMTWEEGTSRRGMCRKMTGRYQERKAAQKKASYQAGES